MEDLPSKQGDKQGMYQMITAKTSKTDLIRQFNGLTLPIIVKERFPSIGELARHYGQEQLEKCICVLTADLNESFEGELSKENIEELAVEISSGLTRNHSLESIYWTFRKIKASDVFGKLTVNKVLKAIDKSLEELSNAISNENYNQHLSLKYTEPRLNQQELRNQAGEQLRHAKTYFEIQAAKKK